LPLANGYTSERQLLVQLQLNTLQSESEKQNSGTVEQLTSLRTTVLDAVQRTIASTDNPGSLEGRSEQLQLIKEADTTLEALLASSAPPTPEMRILKQIYFQSIYSREDAMERAHSGTFEWILEEEAGGVRQDSESEGSGHEESAEDEESEDQESEDQESEDDSDSGTESGNQDQEIKALQSQTRDTLISWLRTGNKVFHISGKAGSGKSTLMKLLADHQRTLEELNYWAADKRLVFAHFFFWRSGDKLQRSLEGLYRSILFESLKQCPDLIKEVFPEAFDTFSRETQHNCIDELFFRSKDFERGFQRLRSKSPNPGYRFCFFIDGLDEYGEDGNDRLHHETLAKDLESWASKDDIKILVSSRPHMEFQLAFSDDFRIKLHDLTKPDITRFGEQMFEGDRDFSRVEGCYKDLVSRVVQRSDGVFLWARLTVRSLLVAVRRRDTIDSLEYQLDNTPKDVNDLYHNLLESINPSDRVKTFKMLLLADCIYDLTAVALTWIDNLDEANFPASCIMKPYTDDEIRERQLAAEIQLDYFTRGLLEIWTDRDFRHNNDLIFVKRVRFFHRTVRDFVSQSKQLRDFSAEFPSIVSDETRAQIYLGGLWFAKPGCSASHNNAADHLFFRWPPGASRDIWLDMYERVHNYHKPRGWLELVGKTFHPRSSRYSSTISEQQSFLHWVASDLGDMNYVIRKLSKTPHLLHQREGLSLLLSAALSRKTASTLTRLFELGVSPNEEVKISHTISPEPSIEEQVGLDTMSEYGLEKSLSTSGVFQTSTTTVWKSFCAYFATRTMSIGDHSKTEVPNCCRGLEEFLSTGQVDANCFVFFTLQKRAQDYKRGPTHFISLRELVQQFDPPNWETLSKQMRPRLGFFTGLQNAWKNLTTFKSDQSFVPEEYLPFNLDMLPLDQDDLFEEFSEGKHWFIVHSLRWRDEQLMVPHLWVRRY
jgi:NACHT domain